MRVRRGFGQLAGITVDESTGDALSLKLPSTNIHERLPEPVVDLALASGPRRMFFRVAPADGVGVELNGAVVGVFSLREALACWCSGPS